MSDYAAARRLLAQGCVGTSVNDGPVAIGPPAFCRRFDVTTFDRLADDGFATRDSLSSGRVVLYHWRYTGKGFDDAAASA